MDSGDLASSKPPRGIAVHTPHHQRGKRKVKAKPAHTMRGRPPQAPRTEIARWLQNHAMTTVDLASKMAEIAHEVGLSQDDVPTPKTLLDAVNGRRSPKLPVVLLIRHVTCGEVDVEHWVRDLNRWGA